MSRGNSFVFSNIMPFLIRNSASVLLDGGSPLCYVMHYMITFLSPDGVPRQIGSNGQRLNMKLHRLSKFNVKRRSTFRITRNR